MAPCQVKPSQESCWKTWPFRWPMEPLDIFLGFCFKFGSLVLTPLSFLQLWADPKWLPAPPSISQPRLPLLVWRDLPWARLRKPNRRDPMKFQRPSKRLAIWLLTTWKMQNVIFTYCLASMGWPFLCNSALWNVGYFIFITFHCSRGLLFYSVIIPIYYWEASTLTIPCLGFCWNLFGGSIEMRMETTGSTLSMLTIWENVFRIICI